MKFVASLYAPSHRGIGVNKVALAFLEVSDELWNGWFNRTSCGANGGIESRPRVDRVPKRAVAIAANEPADKTAMQRLGYDMF